MNDPSPAFASRIASTYFLDSNLPKVHMGCAACSREMVRPSLVDASMLSGKAKDFLDNFASECIFIPIQRSY